MAKLNVKKANHLIPLEERISKSAQLWISFLIANLPKSKEGVDDFPTLDFSFREVKAAINADGKRRITESKELKKIHKELMGTPLWYEDEDQADMVAWLTRVRWDKKTDRFTYFFHPALKPYLLNVKEHYTLYNYFYRVCLSPNAMKFYELLKMYQYLGKIELEIEEDIKLPLGLKGRYKDYYNFRRRVLDSILQELIDYTDIRYEYLPKKKIGKKVISLEFSIFRNVPKNLPKSILEAVKEQGMPVEQDQNDEIVLLPTIPPHHYSQLQKWGGNDKAINALFSNFKIELIEYQIRHLRRVLKQDTKKIDNPFAWLLKAIQNNYTDTVQDQKKTNLEKRQRIEMQHLKRADLEQQLKRLEFDFFEQKKALCDQLIAQKPNLLHEIVEQHKTINKPVAKAVQKGRSPLEIYTDKWTTSMMVHLIQNAYPDTFASTESKFELEIKKTKKLLGY